MLPLALTRLAVAALLTVVLALRGLKRRALSPSGALAALLVGAATLAADYTFGAILLAFYLSGSYFTKYGSSRKAKFDFQRKQGEGQRTWAQVLATAGIAAGASVLWLLRIGTVGGRARIGVGASPFETAVLIAVLSSLATAAGDTWGSELGMLSTSDPMLLIGCRRVPRGTNGAISPLGTVASAAGGLFIGLVAWVSVCISDAVLLGDTYGTPQSQWPLIPLGLLAGLVGSVVDSVLGSVIQRSWVDEDGKVTGELPAGATVASFSASPLSQKPQQKQQQQQQQPKRFAVVAGWDIVSNEAVNFLSCLITSALFVVVAQPYLK